MNRLNKAVVNANRNVVRGKRARNRAREVTESCFNRVALHLRRVQRGKCVVVSLVGLVVVAESALADRAVLVPLQQNVIALGQLDRQ